MFWWFLHKSKIIKNIGADEKLTVIIIMVFGV